MLVMRVELLIRLHHALVLGVRLAHFDLDNDGLLHLGRDNLANLLIAAGSCLDRCCGGDYCFGHGYAFPSAAGVALATSSRSRAMVLMRAMSSLSERRFLRPSCLPRLFAKRTRKSCSAAFASSSFNSSSESVRIFSS